MIPDILVLTQSEFEEGFPEAFEALPECYQADHCLEFMTFGNLLLTFPAFEQVSALGEWTMCWHPADAWVFVDLFPPPLPQNCN